MKITAILASKKNNSNVNNICKEIIKGAKNKNNEAEIINLYDYNIKSCIGCYTCTKKHKCSIKDDFEILFEREKQSDVIIFGTPIYSHSIASILKTFIERHAHAVIPYVNSTDGLSYFGKVKVAMKYMKEFKENRPFIGKEIITVITCTTPNKNNKDVKNANYIIKSFNEEMGLKWIKNIVYSDTLFRFNTKRIDKINKEAYKLGIEINK
jgi:multimeric flavodoxin WrbA